jgi:uncharacterized membrane protein YqjE
VNDRVAKHRKWCLRGAVFVGLSLGVLNGLMNLSIWYFSRRRETWEYVSNTVLFFVMAIVGCLIHAHQHLKEFESEANQPSEPSQESK